MKNNYKKEAWDEAEEVNAFVEWNNKKNNFFKGVILGDDGKFDIKEVGSKIWSIITLKKSPLEVLTSVARDGVKEAVSESKSIEEGGDGPAKNVKFLGETFR